MAGEQTLAQRIRAKYPSAYDDLSDEQLEAAIDKKYPGAYDDIPRSKKGFLDRLTTSLAHAQGIPEMEQVSAQGQAQIGIGAAKGAANTAIGLGQAFDRFVPGVHQISEAIHGAVPPNTFDAARGAFATPANQLQRVGFGAEQVGEFFGLPAAKGGLVTRMATEGAQAGALSATQGADPRAVALSALPGAIGPIASHAAPAMAAAAGVLKDSAKRNVSQAFNPTTRRAKRQTEQIAPGILERGTFAMTKQGLKDRASQEMDALGAKYDEAAAALPTGDRLPVDPVREVIQREMLGLLKKGSGGKSVPVNPQKYQALEELDNTLNDLGDKVSRETLQDFKEEWMEAVAEGGGYAEKTGDALTKAQLWAKRKGADAIRRELAQDSPSIDTLNAEYSFWAKVHDVADATVMREKPQKGAMRRMAGLFGATVGASQGGIQGGVIGAGVGSQLMRAFDSPGWKLASAHAKNKLAEALASGDPGRVGTAIGRVMASMPAQFRPMQPVASH